MSELKDQAAHFTVGSTIGLLTGNPLAGASAALLTGLVREYTEWQLKPDRGRFPWKGHGSILSSGSIRDLIVWTLGGLVGGFL